CRLIVREIIEARHAIVSEAESGADAIEQILRESSTAQPFSLVIIDHLMPGMDGIETIERIRGLDPGRAPSIIMLSSSNLPETLAKVRRAGIECYLLKPIRRGQLYAAIDRALQRPLPPSSTRVAAHPSAPLNVIEKPLKILIADDSPDNRLLVKAYLRKTPYTPEEAADGRTALEMVLSRPYDVVLMDIQMPVMDGFTAVQQIRAWEAREKRRPLPIIALTASALAESVKRIRQTGFDLHVTKPVKQAR